MRRDAGKRRLVIFDVDGTLVDSIGHIEPVMEAAFRACDLPPPPAGAVRALIGVSLPALLARLRPDLPEEALTRLGETYRRMFHDSATRHPVAVIEPLFPGTREMLDTLAARDDVVLAVATGKSRRGLSRMLAGHGLDGYFACLQTADDHPSKPHPAMVRAALSETGVAAARAVLIGDTSYDLDMARAAGVAAIGVPWGNHGPEVLGPLADHMMTGWADLPGLLDQVGEVA